MAPGASARERLTRLLRLASVVVSVTLLSLAPVVGHSRWLQSLQQLQQRLLLWTRDLTHAYWAANLWSWYNSADWLLVQMLHRASVERQAPPVYATGLVQLFSHELLPDVSPLFADCVTAALMAPVLRLLWTRSAETRDAVPLLLRCSVICATSAFLAAWHVHEKALLTALLPLSAPDAAAWLLMATPACVSLMPLLPWDSEAVVALLFATHVGAVGGFFQMCNICAHFSCRHSVHANMQKRDRHADMQTERHAEKQADRKTCSSRGMHTKEKGAKNKIERDCRHAYKKGAESERQRVLRAALEEKGRSARE